MKKLKNKQNFRIKRFLGSTWCFSVVLILFSLGVSWVIVSARYPMAFDENYHYGIIQQYAKQASPFITHAPVGTEKFGDITRYPSYLYHYLLSFPYRLIAHFAHTDQARIITLRFINLLFFVLAIIYFRALLLGARAGPATTNIVLAVFLLIPNVDFLAAHINYDNLLILGTAIVLYYGVQLIQKAQKGVFDGSLLVKITTINLLTCLVVFTHLPVFFATEVFVVCTLAWYAKKRRQPLIRVLYDSFRLQKPALQWLWAILLVVSVGLFAERYGLNQLRYHNLIPDCGQILPVKSCQQYGPWGRDYKLMHKPPSTISTARYFARWAGQNMYELFFTINYNYVNEPPLPLPFAVTWALSVLGFILAIFNWRKIKRNVYFVFFSFVSIVFAVSLWINNLNRFHRVGMPVAIHGRYWMPLLPIIILLFGLGIRYTLNRLPDYSNKLTAPLALIVLLLLCQGGGITSFIIKSNADWYWPDKRVDSVNSTVRTVLAKLIVH